MNAKPKIHVACALSIAPYVFLQRIEMLKRLLRERGICVLDFAWRDGQSLPGVNVYNHDLANVEACDLLVALLDHPSVGLGIELERAFAIRKPVLAFAQPGTYITKIVRDALDKFAMPQPLPYVHQYEIVARVVEALRAVGKISE